MKQVKRYLRPMVVLLLLTLICAVPTFAANGDVADAVEQTWKTPPDRSRP